MQNLAEIQREVVLGPNDGLLNAAAEQEMLDAVGYQALRELASARRADMLEDPTVLKEFWLPTTPQIDAIHNALAPKTPYLTARKRLIALEDSEPASSPIELLDHQDDLFMQATSSITAERDSQRASICIVSPTGSGKTHILFKYVETLHRPIPPETGIPASDRPVRTIIFVDTNSLLRQTVETAQKLIPDIEVGTYNKDNKDLTKPVTVMTYKSFIEAEKSGIIKKGDFDNVLLDEADIALAPETRAQMKDFMSQSVALGFTATGKYNENRHVGMLFENVVEDLDLKRAIEEGILSPVQIWLVPTGERLEIGTIHRFKDLPAESALELSKRINRAAISCKITSDFVKQGMRGLVKCLPGGGSAHAIERADQLNKITITDVDGKQRRVRAAAVGSSIKESPDLIDAYKRGELDVLCFVKLLGRGFDDPETAFFVDESASLSPVQCKQSWGRTFRKVGNKIAHVVHLVDELTSGGELKPIYTMLHALGIKEYTPGLYVGPDDRFIGNAKRHDVKPLEALKLFSHEIFRLINNLPVNILEAYTIGAKNHEAMGEGFISVQDLRKQLDASTVNLRNFFDDNNIKPIKRGNKLYVRSEYLGIYRDYQALKNSTYLTLEGWVSVTPGFNFVNGKYARIDIDKDMADQLAMQNPSLKPLIFPKGPRIKKKFFAGTPPESAPKGTVLCYSPSQVEIIKDMLENAESIAKVNPQFKVKGDFLMNFFVPDDTYNHRYSIPHGWRSISETMKSNLSWQELRTINEEYYAAMQQFKDTPFFTTLRSFQGIPQDIYDEAAAEIGLKGRVVLGNGKTFGYLLNDQELEHLISRFKQDLPTIDTTYRYGDNRDSNTRVEVSHALEAVQLLFRDFPSFTKQLELDKNWKYNREQVQQLHDKRRELYVQLMGKLFSLTPELVIVANDYYQSEVQLNAIVSIAELKAVLLEGIKGLELHEDYVAVVEEAMQKIGKWNLESGDGVYIKRMNTDTIIKN